MTSRASILAWAVLAASSCGGQTTTPADDGEPGAAPTPTDLFVPGEACPEKAPIGDAEALLGADPSGATVFVVEVFYASECTGAGGEYLLARTFEGARSFWLGAHACDLFDDVSTPTPAGFGVLLANQTAGLFHLDPAICVGFPGEPAGVSTDSSVLALALFPTREDAEAFASAIAEPTP